jgi:ABC-type nitrate/sulfonate/bicarbonate transport system ATPase subunit
MSVKIQNISLKYLANPNGKAHISYILKDLNLEIKEGEFTCLLGPSGCGKSSLLGLVAGFVKPSQGEIFVNEKKVIRPDISRTLVFQEYALFPWLNVIENVAFGLRYLINDSEQRYLTASRYLKMVGLIDHARDSISQLSGGMKQRVALARALAVKPELLLMDEPFGALDDKTRSDMQKLLINIWMELKPMVIFVTHSIDEALVLADRIIVMDKDKQSGIGLIKADIKINSERPRLLAELGAYRNQVVDVLYGSSNAVNNSFDAVI